MLTDTQFAHIYVARCAERRQANRQIDCEREREISSNQGNKAEKLNNEKINLNGRVR